MAAKTISTAELFDEINVDIEGDLFKLRQATRSVEEKFRSKMRDLEAKEGEQVEGADDAEKEAAVTAEMLDLYGDLLDIWLEPAGESKTRAKTVVKRAYKADQIGFSHLEELVRQIGEAGQRRPT
jgi:hypothetical protein